MAVSYFRLAFQHRVEVASSGNCASFFGQTIVKLGCHGLIGSLASCLNPSLGNRDPDIFGQSFRRVPFRFPFSFPFFSPFFSPASFRSNDRFNAIPARRKETVKGGGTFSRSKIQFPRDLIGGIAFRNVSARAYLVELSAV